MANQHMVRLCTLLQQGGSNLLINIWKDKIRKLIDRIKRIEYQCVNEFLSPFFHAKTGHRSYIESSFALNHHLELSAYKYCNIVYLN